MFSSSSTTSAPGRLGGVAFMSMGILQWMRGLGAAPSQKGHQRNREAIRELDIKNYKPSFAATHNGALIEKKMNRRHVLMLAGLASVLVACGKRKPSVAALKSDARVLALGDSLTVGYGASPEQAWPALLAQQTGWHIDNEGVNGDTSAGALQRLESLLAANSYDAVLIGIGGNDMLRGVSQQATKDNVAAIVRKAL